MSDDDFFEIAYDDREVPERIPRDRWKRPLIKHPETGELVAYTRASSLAGYIENKSGLHIWDVRQVVRGLAIREDLVWMAAALPPLTDDKKKDAPTNARLSELADEARVAAGADVKANYGTAVHGFTEPEQRGRADAIPQVMRDDVASYWQRVDEYGLIHIASEVFVVCDELEVAGTFDDLYWSWSYGLIVGDKKSGKQNIHSILIQLAAYANAKVYDPETGERRPLTSLLPEEFQRTFASAEQAQMDVLDREHALYVHIPKGEGRTEFYELDIVLGYEAARHAAWVGKYHKRKDLVVKAHDKLVDGVESTRTDVQQYLAQATSREDLKAIYDEFKPIWTEHLTSIGQSRLVEIQKAHNESA